MRMLFRACVLGLLAAGSLAGQTLSDQKLPEPPDSGLSDASEVLGVRSDARRRVEAKIGDLAREKGYRLFVVLERSLISSDPNDLAAQLQQEWLPDGGGLVVVYESDTRELGFGRNLDPGEGITPGRAGVPSYELVKIIAEALADSKKEMELEKPEPFVEALVVRICDGIEAYFARKEAPVDSDRSLRLALVTVGALSLLALCGMGLGWLMGRADRRQTEIRWFPEIDVPERLGAPYGGGGGGTGSFGRRGKEIT